MACPALHPPLGFLHHGHGGHAYEPQEYFDHYEPDTMPALYGQAAEMASEMYNERMVTEWRQSEGWFPHPQQYGDEEGPHSLHSGRLSTPESFREGALTLQVPERTMARRRPPPLSPTHKAPRRAVSLPPPEPASPMSAHGKAQTEVPEDAWAVELPPRRMMHGMGYGVQQGYMVYGDYGAPMGCYYGADVPQDMVPPYMDDAPPPPPPPPGSCYTHGDRPPTTMPLRQPLAWQGTPPTAQPPARPPPPPQHAFEAEPAKQQRGAKKKGKVARSAGEEPRQQDGQQQQPQQEQQQRSKSAENAEQQAKVAPAAELSDIASQVEVDDPRIQMPVWRSFVVSVRLRRSTGSFYFRASLPEGQHVLVAADRGYDLGVVQSSIRTSEVGHQDLPEAEFSRSLPPVVLRHAKDDEVDKWSNLAEMEEKALVDAKKLLSQTQMPRKVAMTLTTATYQFDMRKLSFTYEADQYVNYRPLLKSFFDAFQCRIWFAKVDGPEEAEAP
eukprot:Hpha_TRINITY_DN16385_c3_g1::TRINITY_DN16385_c3_g1_i1::g.58210::m.58210